MWPLSGNWPMLQSKGLDPLPVLDNSKGALQFQSLCREAVASLHLLAAAGSAALPPSQWRLPSVAGKPSQSRWLWGSDLRHQNPASSSSFHNFL